jgi:tyrosinase
MKVFNSVFAIGLLLGLGTTAQQGVLAQPGPVPNASRGATAANPIRIRKDWEDLRDDEKKAFAHAVDILKKKSQQNIYDRTGFLWQAWVHNCTTVTVPDGRQKPMSEASFKKLLGNNTIDSCDPRNFVEMPDNVATHVESPGECEHQKDIFLQWHRAELWFFEQALRAADPDGSAGGPSTKDVTLPYWNFTRKPSGKRYPKEFEDPSSPLFDQTRNQDPLPSSLPTTSPYLLAYLIYSQDWKDFGGDTLGGLGQGNLETKIHNHMHSRYIGGHMADNTKAAMDPIFYVFHNFLDFALDAWISKHGADSIPAGSSRSDYLRAQQNGGFARPVGFDQGQSDPIQPGWGSYIGNMGRAEIYLNRESLGYTFDDPNRKIKDELIPSAQIIALIKQHEAAGFKFGDKGMSLMSTLLSYGSSGAAADPGIRLTGQYTIPGQPIASGNTARLRFTRAQTKSDYSFCADVYLYPEGTREDIKSLDFRNRWLVANTAHWGLAHNHLGSGIMLNDDVTQIVNSLVAGKNAGNWNITLAISQCAAGTVPSASDFSVPYVEIQSK